MRKLVCIVILIIALGELFGFGLSFRDDNSVDIQIVAVVGSKPILTSELDQLLMVSGIEIPDDSTAFYALYAQILTELINEELVYQAAESESLDVDEEMLQQEFEARWDTLTAQFGGENSLADTLAAEGLSVSSFKRKVKSQVRTGIMKQLYIQNHVAVVEVSDDDVAVFFTQYRDSLADYPMQVGLVGILLTAPADSLGWISALGRADSIHRELESGKDFATAAAEHSDDARTASDAGTLGEFDIDDLPEHFNIAIQSMEANSFSEPIKGDEGYHILKLLSRTEDKVDISHIFTKIPDSDESALEIANMVYDSARTGADFDRLVETYCTEGELKDEGGAIGLFPVTALPPAIALVAESLGVGTVIPPIPQAENWVVYKIAEIIPPEPMSLEKHSDVLREMARRDKFTDRLNKLIDVLRSRIYVDIRHPILAVHLDLDTGVADDFEKIPEIQSQ